jgi:RND superfamily putative drug exporter
VAAVGGPASVPAELNVGATVSPTGDAARYVLVFEPDPLGAAAIDTLDRIDRRMPRLLARAGLPEAEVAFAGDTALVAETVHKTFDDLARVAPVTILAVLLVLVLFLRALVAPLYLVFASVLAVAAALGLTAYVFTEVLGYSELTYYAPFTIAVLLVALGSDYNVFIVGRIWQQVRSLPLREAIIVGGTRAARPITVAGVILGLSFALLALVPLQGFREIAFAMTTGLLIDAFLVRTLLVPALISLFGEAGGWPGRRLRPRRAAQ